MGLDTQASDWRVRGTGKFSMGTGLSIGLWFFVFKSYSAKCTAVFAFYGAGLGVGLNVNGIPPLPSGPLFVKGDGTMISCERLFSAADLNGKFGTVASMGAAAGAGYSFTTISAFSLTKNYIKFQQIRGWSVGAGASAVSTWGTWWLISNPKKLGIVIP